MSAVWCERSEAYICTTLDACTMEGCRLKRERVDPAVAALTPTGNPLTEEQIADWRKFLQGGAIGGWPVGCNVLCDMALAALRQAQRAAVAYCPASEDGCSEDPICKWPCKKITERA